MHIGPATRRVLIRLLIAVAAMNVFSVGCESVVGYVQGYEYRVLFRFVSSLIVALQAGVVVWLVSVYRRLHREGGRLGLRVLVGIAVVAIVALSLAEGLLLMISFQY